MNAGRLCPLHYRYAPAVFSRAADCVAETIYVIGGLYGNLQALNEIESMAARESVPPVLVFNGDFNWFNVDAASFETVNARVLRHTALRGNVETELSSDADEAGCGCAYPDYVSDEDVERSNSIMQRLRATATAFPDLTTRLSALPMHLVAEVGGARIGIVHGDAESLSGWRFAHDSLHQPQNVAWLQQVCAESRLVGFASSHTCLPTLRQFDTVALPNGSAVWVANNGAAGMPNFARTQYGLITRLSVHPPADGAAQYGFAQPHKQSDTTLYVDALPIHYDATVFTQKFDANWDAQSPAALSYASRIANGPNYAPPHALGIVRAPSVCA